MEESIDELQLMLVLVSDESAAEVAGPSSSTLLIIAWNRTDSDNELLLKSAVPLSLFHRAAGPWGAITCTVEAMERARLFEVAAPGFNTLPSESLYTRINNEASQNLCTIKPRHVPGVLQLWTRVVLHADHQVRHLSELVEDIEICELRIKEFN